MYRNQKRSPEERTKFLSCFVNMPLKIINNLCIINNLEITFLLFTQKFFLLLEKSRLHCHRS